MPDLERRLSKIERALGLRKEPAKIGIYDPTRYGELIGVGGHTVTREEFLCRYPDGILLTVVRDLTTKPKEDG